MSRGGLPRRAFHPLPSMMSCSHKMCRKSLCSQPIHNKGQRQNALLRKDYRSAPMIRIPWQYLRRRHGSETNSESTAASVGSGPPGYQNTPPGSPSTRVEAGCGAGTCQVSAIPPPRLSHHGMQLLPGTQVCRQASCDGACAELPGPLPTYDAHGFERGGSRPACWTKPNYGPALWRTNSAVTSIAGQSQPYSRAMQVFS